MDAASTTYLPFAAAFVRGTLSDRGAGGPLFERPLGDLGDDDLAELVRLGREAGLRLHPFKRSMLLARVRKVLGYLHGLRPATLLDVGSGRGAFLWPCLEAFPDLRVTAIDLLDPVVADLRAVARGGIDRLEAHRLDVHDLGSLGSRFDGVTLLETLEHTHDPARVAREAVRIAERFVIVSVPSKPDDNPEHLHLFDREALRRLFTDAGAKRVAFDAVLNHHLLVVRT